MFGSIVYEDFKALDKMPQKAATAWAEFEAAGLGGATYKPLLYVGHQTVKGTNYIFIAEQRLMTAAMEKRLVTIKITEFEGQYSLGLQPFKEIEF